MSRLHTLELTNFLGFEALTLSFEPDVTVLVGANGAGKTSILNAIRWCATAFLGRLSPPSAGLVQRSGAASPTRARLSGAGWFTEFGTGGRSEGGSESFPLLVHYGETRHVVDHTPGSTDARAWRPSDATESWFDAPSGYPNFFRWFREMEDLENEQIRYGQATEHRGLSAVRRAVLTLFPEFVQIRVHRQLAPFSTGPVLGLTRADGTTLPFSSFSEGERTTVALVADVARRLALLDQPGDPLAAEATVLVDEIEQHCHPAWQRRLVPGLRRVFPNVQWVWTTHSPVIVSECEPRQLRVLRDFRLVESGHSPGLDANAVLEDVFGQPARKREVQDALDAVQRAVDDGDLALARAHLSTLARLTDEGGDWHHWDAVVQRLGGA